MKKQCLTAGTALCACIWFAAASASAQELEIAYATEYVDTATFNQRFSDEPVVQLTATFEFGNFYLEPYVYLDTDDLLDGASSEYGFEFGGEWEVGGCASVNLAGGRWMNYAGQGADVGDWFGRAGISCNGASLAVTSLFGDTDDTLVHAGYELSLGERLTLTPSAAYSLEWETWSPGFEANLALTDTMTLTGQLVYPEVEDEDTGEIERELYGAVRIAFTLGGE